MGVILRKVKICWIHSNSWRENSPLSSQTGTKIHLYLLKLEQKFTFIFSSWNKVKYDVLYNRSNTTNEHEKFDLLVEKREHLIGRVFFVETFDEPGLSQHPETGCHRLGQGQISAGSHLLLHDRARRGIARPGEKQTISFLPFLLINVLNKIWPMLSQHIILEVCLYLEAYS